MEGLVQELLGCQWGRAVSLPDDKEPCPRTAVGYVVLHDGPATLPLKLCDEHRKRIEEETDPH